MELVVGLAFWICVGAIITAAAYVAWLSLWNRARYPYQKKILIVVAALLVCIFVGNLGVVVQSTYAEVTLDLPLYHAVMARDIGKTNELISAGANPAYAFSESSIVYSVIEAARESHNPDLLRAVEAARPRNAWVPLRRARKWPNQAGHEINGAIIGWRWTL